LEEDVQYFFKKITKKDIVNAYMIIYNGNQEVPKRFGSDKMPKISFGILFLQNPKRFG
jgi:hypothetical protein